MVVCGKLRTQITAGKLYLNGRISSRYPRRKGGATDLSSGHSGGLTAPLPALILPPRSSPSRSGGMADAGDSKSPVLTGVQVRLLSPAPGFSTALSPGG